MTRLLVVDDNEQDRYLLEALLKGNGFEVMTAGDGAEALEKAQAAPPDLIITDILMPGMDGYALCRHWKRDGTLNGIPFVFYTATYTDPRDEKLALSLGAERFIVKPQEPEALVQAVNEVLSERSTRRARTPAAPALDETVYFQKYNAALVRKLEDKLVELESAKASLEQEVKERRRAEEEAVRIGREWQRTFDATDSAVWILDADHRIMRSNRSSERHFPYTCEALNGRHCWEIVHGTQAPIPECPVVRARQSLRREFQELFIKGRWYEITVDPILNSGGHYEGAVHIVSDVTERRSLEEQLHQAQKMEAIGHLAGGVAHDFNNILQAIVAYSSILLESLPEHDEKREFADEISRGAQRASALTRQLLAFSRRQILEMQDLDMNAVVRGLVTMIRRLIGADIDVKVREGRNLGIVHADRGQMEQVLLNLCVNARDAMPEGGVLTIETEHVVMDQEYCKAHGWASPGRYVLLGVSDTGCGMDAETQERIFEPFFTTKELGKGTGLGLATVYGIVRQHQGMVQVYSEFGKGTRFSVYLPSIEPSELYAETEPVERARGGTETILVAEDDPTVRKLAARILENAGYTVLPAGDGREAIEIFNGRKDPVDLIILDVVMPKMGGKPVYDVLHQEHAGLRFLFSSGYGTEAIHTGFVLNEGIELIQKPYAPDALLRKVREVLDKAPGKSKSR